MAVQVNFNGAALKAIALAASADDIKVRANRVLNYQRRAIKVDTGRARASLHIEYTTAPDGSTVARIGSNLPHVLFLNTGTGIYGPRGTPIRPKNGRLLVFPAVNNSGKGPRRYKNGKTATHVFTRSVKGMKGDEFMLRSLDAAR